MFLNSDELYCEDIPSPPPLCDAEIVQLEKELEEYSQQQQQPRTSNSSHKYHRWYKNQEALFKAIQDSKLDITTLHLYSSDVAKNNSCKKFTFFKSKEDAFSYETALKGEKTMYEIVPTADKVSCHPFLDMDISNRVTFKAFFELSYEDQQKQIDLFLIALESEIEKLFGRKHVCTFYHSVDKKKLKWSFHMLIRKLHFNSWDTVKTFAKYLKYKLKNHPYGLAASIDEKIYSNFRSIRCLNSTKMGQDRPKLFLRGGSNTFEDSLITNIKEDSVLTELPSTVTLSTVEETSNKRSTTDISSNQTKKKKIVGSFDNGNSNKKSIVQPELTKEEKSMVLEVEARFTFFKFLKKCNPYLNFLRLMEMYCIFCKRVHDNDNSLFVTMLENGDYQIRCTKFKNAHIICNRKSTLSLPLDVPIETYKKSKMDPYNVSTYKTLAIVGGMGTAKTEMLEKLVEMRQFDDYEINMVSIRCSLTDQTVKRFQGFVDYRASKTPILNDSRKIFQYESGWRCGVSNNQKILILDEIEQAISQINSNLGKHKTRCWKMFEFLLRESDIVIVLDACCGFRTFDLLERTRPKETTKIIFNEWQPRDRIEYYQKEKLFQIYEKEMDFSDMLYADFKHIENSDLMVTRALDGKQKKLQKVFVATTSKAWGDKVAEKLKETKLKVLYLYANCPLEARSTLKSVDEFWLSYDVVIITPTVTAGFSFTLSGFDRVYGYFCPLSADYIAAIQMLGRVRDISTAEYHIYISDYGKDSKKTAPMITKQNVESMLESHEGVFKLESDGYDLPSNYEYTREKNVYPYKDLYYHVTVNNIVHRYNSIHHFRTLFTDMAIRLGMTVMIIDERAKTEEERKISRESEKELKNKVKENAASKTMNALSISDDLYNQLKEKTDKGVQLTQDQILSVKKLELCKLYGINQTDLSVEFIKYYDRVNIKSTFLRLQRGHRIMLRSDSFHENVCACECCTNGSTDPLDKISCFKDAHTINDPLFGKNDYIRCHLANLYLLKLCKKKLIEAIDIVVDIKEFSTWMDNVIAECVTHLDQTREIFLQDFNDSYKTKEFQQKLRFINCIFNRSYGTKWKSIRAKTKGREVISVCLEMLEFFKVENNSFKVDLHKLK
jgi:hypothetical protein